MSPNGLHTSTAQHCPGYLALCGDFFPINWPSICATSLSLLASHLSLRLSPGSYLDLKNRCDAHCAIETGFKWQWRSAYPLLKACVILKIIFLGPMVSLSHNTPAGFQCGWVSLLIVHPVQRCFASENSLWPHRVQLSSSSCCSAQRLTRTAVVLYVPSNVFIIKSSIKSPKLL